jgi:3-hydroxyisobutyrate dehydrogenase-like beta-hydroxyacid dehydrogenase
MNDILRVGFVGLGNIGKPMALRLADAPASSRLSLGVHDVVPEPVAALERAGATAYASVAELAAASELLCVMVRDDDQVRDVLGEVLGTRRSPRRRRGRWR